MLQRPIKIAPGDTGSGPCIGHCQSDGKILTLAHGRRWAQASAGVIIDAGLASGPTTGYPANHNLPQSIAYAHSAPVLAPNLRRRRPFDNPHVCEFATVAIHPAE